MLYYWKKIAVINYSVIVCEKVPKLGGISRGCLVQLLSQHQAGLVRSDCSVSHPAESWKLHGLSEQPVLVFAHT